MRLARTKIAKTLHALGWTVLTVSILGGCGACYTVLDSRQDEGMALAVFAEQLRPGALIALACFAVAAAVDIATEHLGRRRQPPPHDEHDHPYPPAS